MEKENRKNSSCAFCPVAELCNAENRRRAPLHALAACAYANGIETTLRNDLKRFERGKTLRLKDLSRELSKRAAAALLVLQEAWEADETSGLDDFAAQCEEIWVPYFDKLVKRQNRN